ncbi:MAG: phosphate ABC transporter ATP-binding protein PstB [Candidatus Dormibacteria bacterium]
MSAQPLSNGTFVSQTAIRSQAQPVEDLPLKVQTVGFNAYYGAFQSLRSVDFGAPVGAVTAIIGPSGCGKSTLLRSLNHMNDLVPGFRSEGPIMVDGEDINVPGHDLIATRRRIGMLFQRPNPFPMSIRDNVAYGLRLGGRLPRDELNERVRSALERVGLLDEVADRLERSALSLSGGQQQRLCLARTLAVEPEVILMDEPTSALDPIATLRIEELLLGLRGTVTMIVVTHNMQQAARMSDYTAFMLMGEGRAGELVESAPTPRLFSKPEDSRTEDYITGRFG